jgi:hypothetical protein
MEHVPAYVDDSLFTAELRPVGHCAIVRVGASLRLLPCSLGSVRRAVTLPG